MKPVAYAIFAENGNIRLWSTNHEEATKHAIQNGLEVIPLFAPKQAETGKRYTNTGNINLMEEDTNGEWVSIADYEGFCQQQTVTDCLKALIADTDEEEVVCLLQMITRKEI